MRFATHILIAATFIPLFASCGKRQSDDFQSQTDNLPSESDKFTGPWDIVFLDVATGEPTGNRIRQRNRVVDISLSNDGKVLINSCRKAIPGQHKVDRRDKSVLGFTYQRSPEQWFLQLYGESGRQVWRSGPCFSAKFLVGIASGHSRIAFAVFPDERKQPNDQDAK
jgi:hypothetical protein